VTEFELVAFSLEAEEDGQIGLVLLEQLGHHVQGVSDARLKGSPPVLLAVSLPVRLPGGGESVVGSMRRTGRARSQPHVVR
jgi:hypothetical protein